MKLFMLKAGIIGTNHHNNGDKRKRIFHLQFRKKIIDYIPTEVSSILSNNRPIATITNTNFLESRHWLRRYSNFSHTVDDNNEDELKKLNSDTIKMKMMKKTEQKTEINPIIVEQLFAHYIIE
ncbi:hypothetical protein DERP_007008 [Dermatophagoides pteronyssinus]|uniref:Uncharacterized protein n=1 Tax=Dermatophagoides pteronyssinus TaxID=6956 RepID=A0ABQ8JTW5_DERPT|nr:hypothetical protein DERP_007008 [Dermatophagoides pteronyssinus]